MHLSNTVLGLITGAGLLVTFSAIGILTYTLNYKPEEHDLQEKYHMKRSNSKNLDSGSVFSPKLVGITEQSPLTDATDNPVFDPITIPLTTNPPTNSPTTDLISSLISDSTLDTIFEELAYSEPTPIIVVEPSEKLASEGCSSVTRSHPPNLSSTDVEINIEVFDVFEKKSENENSPDNSQDYELYEVVTGDGQCWCSVVLL